MSAAAAVAIPQPVRKKAHAVLMARSFFLLDLPKAARVCLGLIEEKTRGFGRKSAHIPRSRFMSVANVGYDEISSALAVLKERKLIRVIEATDSQGKRADQYQSTVENAPEHTAVAECRECGASGVVDLAKGRVPTPHAYLTELPACVTESEYVVIGLVLIRTIRWTAQDGGYQFSSQPQEIKSADLEWESALGPTAVAAALQKAAERGILHIQARPGKPSLVSVHLDPMGNFKKVPKLDTRIVSISYNRSNRDKKQGGPAKALVLPEPVEVIETTEETPSDETVPLTLPGFCRNCGIFSPKRIIAMPAPDTFLTEQPFSHTRAGPGPPKWQKFKQREAIAEDLREIHALVAQWSRGFSAAPSADLVRAVSDAMQGCPVELVERRFAKRQDAIRAARAPGILVSLAQDAGEYWLLSQQLGFNPLRFEQPDTLRASFSSKQITIEQLTEYAVSRRISTGRAQEILAGQGYECV